MTSTADVERADRLGRSRARILAVQGILFLSWQGMFFAGPHNGAMRPVDAFKISAWLVWAVLLLFVLATGGGLVRGRGLRHLLNDEVTQGHRSRAYTAGFWAAAAASIMLYVLDQFEPVTGREAVHIILSIAVGAALLTFARLERRSRG